MSYFVFEAVDGCGKTTTMKLVAQKLVAKGVDLVCTKEPGGPKALKAEWGYFSHYGLFYDGFRELCVNRNDIPQLTKRAIYLADSIFNWEKVVAPALKEGKVVLSDRSWVSDLAYGTVLAGLPMKSLYDFNNSLTGRRSDITNVVYLHLPSVVREERLPMVDEMDKLGSDTRDKIVTAYSEVFERYFCPDSVFTVSTLDSPDRVSDLITEHILRVSK